MKRNNIKTEETSSSRVGEKDLAYYIHDRVELMHQVFSLLKPKEVRVIAPDSIQDLPVDDVEELCLEELLGISSKRLCAILDGAEPPSDTDSSQHNDEAISLDSISSDEVHFEDNKTKKRHHHSRKRKGRRKSPKACGSNDGPSASNAGLTVLQLLELQARARAIRAQLAKEKALDDDKSCGADDDEDEVMINEVKPEVVELSSDEDVKPRIDIMSRNNENNAIATNQKTSEDKVAQPKGGRIKLKRNNTRIANANNKTSVNDDLNKRTEISKDMTKEESLKKKDQLNNTDANNPPSNRENELNKAKRPSGNKVSAKGAKKKKVKRAEVRKQSGSDDEITLQLSDTEKMNLLEDIDPKQCELVSSESDTDDEDDLDTNKSCNNDNSESQAEMDIKTESQTEDDKLPDVIVSPDVHKEDEKDETPITSVVSQSEQPTHVNDVNKADVNDVNEAEVNDKNKSDGEVSDGNEDKEEGEVIDEDNANFEENCAETSEVDKEKCDGDINTIDDSSDSADDEEDSSDGSRDSSSVIELSNENVDERKDNKSKVDKNIDATDDKDNDDKICIISDDEAKSPKKENNEIIEMESNSSNNVNVNKDITEKEGKSKKKCKNHKKIRSVAHTSDTIKITLSNEADKVEELSNDQDTIDISDDSSCYEVEGITLSKEPTAEEIEALSAKVDALERTEVVADMQIENYESQENISWRERYLSSSKVKRIMTTSNVFNAMRKKNIELKRKLEESKLKAEAERKAEELEKERELEEERKIKEQAEAEMKLEEGTINQYNTLEGSTKYVDPVQEPKVVTNEERLEEIKESNKLLIKDARQLLKMYKKMLKYSGEKDKSDNNEKSKKKKLKKKKKKDTADVEGNE